MGWLFGFKASKCRTQCQLGVARIKLLRNKKNIQLKQLRRDVADLLRTNKHDSARIRVEAVLREQNLLKAFDALELHLELVGVRASLLEKLDAAPEDMIEALSSIVFASLRIGDEGLIPELSALRAMLGRKFGREYVEEASEEKTAVEKWRVSPSLVGLLAVDVPKPEDKAKELAGIAAEFGGIEFDEKAAAEDMRKKGGGGGGGGIGILADEEDKAKARAAEKEKEKAKDKDDEGEEVADDNERESLPPPPKATKEAAAVAAAAAAAADARAAADRASAAADELEKLGLKNKKKEEQKEKEVVAVEVDEKATAADGKPPPSPATTATKTKTKEEAAAPAEEAAAEGTGETAGPFDSVDSVNQAPAPPKGSGSGAAPAAARQASSSTSSSSLGLPTPPPNSGGSGGTVARPPPAPSAPSNELDDLAKRFESLKRGGGGAS